MSELLQAVLENPAARSGSALELAASKVAAQMGPWASLDIV